MVRGAALALVGVLAVTAVATARPKKRRKAAEEEPKQPRAVHLRAIDLAHRLILVEVDGFAKAPPANYFTMTDERARHYIAQTIHCDPPFPSGTRACELEIPIGYERHPLVKLELHVRGLHGPTVAVPADEVRAAWAAAEQAHAPTTGSTPAAAAAPATAPAVAPATAPTAAPATAPAVAPATAPAVAPATPVAVTPATPAAAGPSDGGVLDSSVPRTDAGK